MKLLGLLTIKLQIQSNKNHDPFGKEFEYKKTEISFAFFLCYRMPVCATQTAAL
jgi:hypothetical protein